MRRVGGDVEDPDHAVVETPGPQVTAIVPEARVMRLVPAAHRHRGDHLAVVRRVRRVGADRDQLVGAVTHALDAEGPDVDVVLLPGDLGHVGRHAGLVRAAASTAQEHQQRNRARASDEAVSGHQEAPPWADPRASPPSARRVTGGPAPNQTRRTPSTRRDAGLLARERWGNLDVLPPRPRARGGAPAGVAGAVREPGREALGTSRDIARVTAKGVPPTSGGPASARL